MATALQTPKCSRHLPYSPSHRFPIPSISTAFPTNSNFPRSRPLTWSGLAHVTNAGPPSSPPGPNSPPEKDTATIEGLEASFYRIRDRVQIFFAVLFWISLFFWYSAWDGRNSGRRGKGSRR